MKTLKISAQHTPHINLAPITLIETKSSKTLFSLLAPFYAHLASGKLKKAHKLINELLKNDANNPYFLDCLALCLVKRRRLGKSREIIKRNFHFNSSHLFVKVRYADMLIREKKFAQVAALFENIFDLALLFPEKKVFEIQDYTLFMEMASWYYFSIKEEDKALVYAFMVQNVCKGSSSIAQLMKKMQRKNKPWKKWLFPSR